MRSLLILSLTCLLSHGADPKVASDPKFLSNGKVKIDLYQKLRVHVNRYT